MYELSRRLVFVLQVTLLLFGTEACAQPKYATPQTKDVVEKMIEAHGGMARWRQAPTISFDNLFLNPFAGDGESPWWVSHEVIDQKTRRVYQDWPLYDGQLVWDGTKVWTVNWGNENMPRFMPLFFYYFVDLPWLTQDDSVRLGPVGRSTLAGADPGKEYYTVEMTFTEKPAVGKTANDTYKLYVDPETYLLKGYEYTIGYGAMLDAMDVPQGEVYGPMYRVFDKYVTVDGLVFPTEFHTGPQDGSAVWGYHVVYHYSLDEPFDEARMEMPPGAVVDTSSALRRSEQ